MVRTLAEQTGSKATGSRELTIRARFACTGLVQGVGFRPAVWRLATDLGLVGFVRNDTDGAEIEVQGEAQVIADFALRIANSLPPLARLDTCERNDIPVEASISFEALSSEGGRRRRAMIPPDARLCDDCRADMEEEGGRRHRYAFTTCTNCGPRFSLVRSLPYDRERTSMSEFPLCPDCEAEYNSPSDRRFHAEPTCCLEAP